MILIPANIFAEREPEIGRRAIASFGKKIEKEKGLVLVGSGGSFCNPDLKVLNLTFHANGKYTLPQSRELIVALTEKFIGYINQSGKYLKIFKDLKFDEKNIKMRVSFFIDNSNRSHEATHVAFVTLSRGKLYYFYEPDPQKNSILKEEEIESYEQALAIVMQEKSSAQEELRSP